MHPIATIGVQVLGIFVLIGLVNPILRFAIGRAKNGAYTDQNTFKIYFNRSSRMEAKTPLQIGSLTVGEAGLEITGDTSATIQFADVTSLRLEAPHSRAVRSHIIEIKFRPDELLYFGVLRGSLFRSFVLNNLLQTIALFERIRKRIPQSLAWSVLDKNNRP